MRRTACRRCRFRHLRQFFGLISVSKAANRPRPVILCGSWGHDWKKNADPAPNPFRTARDRAVKIVRKRLCRKSWN